jgi:hypothetical protein
MASTRDFIPFRLSVPTIGLAMLEMVLDLLGRFDDDFTRVNRLILARDFDENYEER